MCAELIAVLLAWRWGLANILLKYLSVFVMMTEILGLRGRDAGPGRLRQGVKVSIIGAAPGRLAIDCQIAISSDTFALMTARKVPLVAAAIKTSDDCEQIENSATVWAET